jgi:hypothetical protein
MKFAWLICGAAVFAGGCGGPPRPLGQSGSSGVSGTPSPSDGAGRYGPGAPERNPSFSQGSDKIVASWDLRSVFVEAYGKFHENPADGRLELRTDGTCSGPQVAPLTHGFDGTYEIKRGWLEFSAFPGEHFDFLVGEKESKYVLTLKSGGVKLTFERSSN